MYAAVTVQILHLSHASCCYVCPVGPRLGSVARVSVYVLVHRCMVRGAMGHVCVPAINRAHL